MRREVAEVEGLAEVGGEVGVEEVVEERLAVAGEVAEAEAVGDQEVSSSCPISSQFGNQREGLLGQIKEANDRML
jgi:hypothetical protein